MEGEDGAEDGILLGPIEGKKEGVMEGAEGVMEGAEVGVSERGSELHVDKPEAVHAGYTQAGAERKGELPNAIPTQFSMITILSLLHIWNV